MLWVKAFHLISMVTWFAALFYLPRLFVYHAMSDDTVSNERFKVMERKLYRGIMMPGALLTLFFGAWLASYYTMDQLASMHWLHAKLTLVFVLFGYHGYCGKLLRQFKNDNNQHSPIFYRWFNEIPVLILVAVVILAVVKPF
ncbi:MAG: TIGR00701 family protein [Gammaproteobacteria bacterium]|nr:MAG: TIGR00701 family protein [Gammaproteobacteria bacterium]